MKEFDIRLVPTDACAVLTAPEIDGQGPMYLADFRDQSVLIFRKSGHFVGYSASRGLVLCRGPLRMVGGMWHAAEDREAAKKFPDVQLSAELLDFRSV